MYLYFICSLSLNIVKKPYILTTSSWQSTYGDARRAVLSDLVKSVSSRWEMHCDSLVEEPPANIAEPIIHEPPRRVFFPCKQTHVHLGAELLIPARLPQF